MIYRKWTKLKYIIYRPANVILFCESILLMQRLLL